MTKKSRQSPPAPAKPSPWLWIVSGAAIVLIVVGLALWWSSTASAPTTPTQTGNNTPRLAVNRTTIDEGEVKLDTPVRSAFRLSNAGSEPLQILGEPQVELVEGC
jgi:hypothetical protein